MSLMHPELIPDEPRRIPARLVIVLVVGVILFGLVYLTNPPQPTPTSSATPTSQAIALPATPTAPSLSAQATQSLIATRISAPDVTLPIRPTATVAAITALTPTPDCNRLTETVEVQSGSDRFPFTRPIVYAERHIEIGAAVVGTLDRCGRAWFTFTGDQGDRVDIEMGVPGGETYLALYDAALYRLIDDPIDTRPEVADIRDYVLPADGTYYILVRDLRSRTLAYSLALLRQP